MARLARDTAAVIHVVVPREQGVVETARGLARHAGVDLEVDLMVKTVRARFDGRPLFSRSGDQAGALAACSGVSASSISITGIPSRIG
jgi:hypothetical protein